MRGFASDNNSGICEPILAAMLEANREHELAYGDDFWSQKLKDCFESLFDRPCDPFVVLTGTGANVIALTTLVRSFECIFCSDISHINVDECGAPEKFIGSKLVSIDTSQTGGKLVPRNIQDHLIHRGFEHHVQPGAVSITQATELGTVYNLSELAELGEFCKAENLKIHMDGARFSNAVASLGCKPSEIIAASGLDILSFGGTKNGMMIGEAIVIFDQNLSSIVPYVRKQASQLVSKMRFISAQFLAFFNDELWLRNARNANAMARLLASRVEQMPGLKITSVVDSNAVFVCLPVELKNWLHEQGYFFYTWNESSQEVRWMTSFDTTVSDVNRFADTIEEGLAKLATGELS